LTKKLISREPFKNGGSWLTLAMDGLSWWPRYQARRTHSAVAGR